MKSLAFCGLLALSSMMSGRAHAEIDRQVFVALAASVLRIEAPQQAGGYALGSAVVVAPDLVVTNCHVTRDAAEVFVVRGGVRWTADTQASDIARDLCLLHVPQLKAQPVRFTDTGSLRVGQAATALGFTGGMGIQNSRGKVLALHRHDGSHVIQTDNWFSSGASGGGLFDDEGRLIGILTFRLRGGEAHYFAAPADWVRQMLAEPERRPMRAVAPLERGPVPYWQQRSSEQPFFLKAAALLRDDRWPELEREAKAWLQAEPGDAEPWALLGTALERQGRLPEARRALECSLKVEIKAGIKTDEARAATRARLAWIASQEAAASAAVPLASAPSAQRADVLPRC